MTPADTIDLSTLPAFDPATIEITDEEILSDLQYPHEREHDVSPAALAHSLARAA